MRRIDPPDDLPRFIVLKRTFGHYAGLRLPSRIEISIGEMQSFEQGMTTPALLGRRPGERLQALVKRVVPRGNSFHLEGNSERMSVDALLRGGRCGSGRFKHLGSDDRQHDAKPRVRLADGRE